MRFPKCPRSSQRPASQAAAGALCLPGPLGDQVAAVCLPCSLRGVLVCSPLPGTPAPLTFFLLRFTLCSPDFFASFPSPSLYSGFLFRSFNFRLSIPVFFFLSISSLLSSPLPPFLPFSPPRLLSPSPLPPRCFYLTFQQVCTRRCSGLCSMCSNLRRGGGQKA